MSLFLSVKQSSRAPIRRARGQAVAAVAALGVAVVMAGSVPLAAQASAPRIATEHVVGTGPGLQVLEMARVPKLVRSYRNSHTTIRFDFGTALSESAHRICLLANQGTGDQELLIGLLQADETYFAKLRTENGDRSIVGPNAEKDCPAEPPLPPQTFERLPIKDEVRQMVLKDNAVRLLGL